MADRDKVIKGLECCTRYIVDCKNCPYRKYQRFGSCCSVLMIEATEIIEKEGIKR